MRLVETSIVVTGIGLTTALGRGVEASWAALREGVSGIAPLTRIDAADYPIRDGGEAPDLDDEPVEDNRDRALGHAVEVGREALTGAGLPGVRVADPDRTVLVVGSSLAASASAPAFWPAFVDGDPADVDYRTLRCYDVEPTLAALAATFAIRGETQLVSNACAAGVSAIALAADALRLGRADAALVIGVDALDPHTFAGFGALKAQSADPMRPFGAGRAGMKLGDGFAALLLEREDRAAGRTPLARLAGYGESADAHHLTQPDPGGRGAALAMRRALRSAVLEPDAIDYVNVHGTATPANDVAEWRAMREVFGERLARIPLGASKPSVGHTLGAAGAVEAVVTILVLRHQVIAPTVGVGTEAGWELDPEIEGGLDLPGEARAATVRHAMCNSFGFGGCNASVVLSAVPAPETGDVVPE